MLVCLRTIQPVVFVVLCFLISSRSSVEAQVWAKHVLAAEAEGRVVVMGPRGPQIRDAMKQFELKYPKIRLEYSSFTGREAVPRIMAERRTGQKLWDVYIGGPNSLLTGLKPIGALSELRRALVLPEVKENKYWHGGIDFGFLDVEKKYVYAFIADVTPPINVNRAMVPTSQFNHPRQLTDPKFKGKIVMEDPRTPGGGAVDLATMMSAYGENFVRTLLQEQQAVFGRDRRQIAEWVVLGKYPIVIGLATTALLEYQSQGLGKEIEQVTAPEVELWSPSNGSLALLEGAPHINAAIVFINWFLSAGPQEAFAKIPELNSRRTDVVPVNASSFPRPERLHRYLRHDESWPVPEKLNKLANSWIK